MKFDIFFSISQTPVDGHMPSEAQMFRSFFQQVKAADEQGYGTAWFAESHLSSEVQKTHHEPVIPHWKGEVGLNVDFVQLAREVFNRTERIEAGSAIMNVICNGGPVAAAERIAYFLTLHGLDPAETRRIHVGFAYGRFEFMNRAYGIKPRDPIETAAWAGLKGLVYREAGEILCRLLAGETLSSLDLPPPIVSREHFRTDDDWGRAQAVAGTEGHIRFDRRWEFEALKLVPSDFRRDLLQLVAGSHDPATQEHFNQFMPVQVFNLSITQPDIIEDTHSRMAAAYHPDGGPWRRDYMPRTAFVFLNDEPGLTPEQRSKKAHEEARAALAAYWTALQGTLDPAKVEKAANNALIGNADEIAQQCRERFHPDDRLMLWFDFFNHDSERVMRNQRAFMEKVAPQLDGSDA